MTEIGRYLLSLFNTPLRVSPEQGPLLQTQINFSPRKDKQPHAQ